ncbi:MAG: hypothetical protein KIT87_02495 [Anaerolineae bacterium]|nr:hypothetical protein [Anaerolineae bacterium]
MSARVEMLKDVAPETSAVWYGRLARYAGWLAIGLGFLTLLPTVGADPAWGAFLIVVGLIAQRVTAPTALALYAVMLGWAGLINGLFGRQSMAGALFLATLITALAGAAAYRSGPRLWPAAPGLAWGSLILACTAALTLIAAFGGSLLAFFTGWYFDARVADYLAAAGVHQSVLAVGLAIGAAMQPSSPRWAAVLGAIGAVTGILAYLSLLLLAQG